MPSIAIFRTGGIGDVILSTVAINIITTLMPEAEIHWFGRQPTLDLIRSCFPKVRTHAFNPGASYRRNIAVVLNAAPRFDLIIDLQRSARTVIIGIACAGFFRCRYATWNKYSIRRSLFVLKSRLTKRSIMTRREALPGRHEAMAACVIRALNRRKWIKEDASAAAFQPAMRLSDGGRRNAIAINLGVLHAGKELPFEKWTAIIDHIVSKQCCSELYFLGDERKHNDAARLIRYAGENIRTVNYCGRTTLAEAAQILASCKCTLTNDTALSHLSESSGTPVIVFFGPTHEQFGYRPFLAESKSISLPLSCRPCTKGGKTGCRFGDFKCFTALDLQPAFDHLDHLAG